MQLQGGTKFAAITLAKTALQSLGQSMFQHYGPQRIHVCNMNTDGVIDSTKTQKLRSLWKIMDSYDIAQQYILFNVYN